MTRMRIRGNNEADFLIFAEVEKDVRLKERAENPGDRLKVSKCRPDTIDFPVLSGVEFVMSQSRWVSVCPELLDGAVALWGDGVSGVNPGWEHICHYSDGTEETVRWIFVLDILNHCFWPDPGDVTWTVFYRGQPWSGYWGLAACLKRAMENGFPVTDANYLAELTARDLQQLLSGEGIIPLFNERLANLREAGRVVQSKWNGDIVQLLDSACGSAVKTVLEIADSFTSFQDEAQYRKRTVYFWKRAQLFVSDVHTAFGGKGWGCFDDIGKLTAFADYKLPQVLRALGVLSYHSDLSESIDNGHWLTPGSEEEVEIRAATIWAVEAFKKSFEKAGKKLNSAKIDNWLWQLGQLEPFRRKPYHRCRTIFY